MKLTQLVHNTLRAHGEETYPHECCGVLLGHANPEGNRVEAAVRAGNTRTDSAHNRYTIDPAELIRIQREARKQGWDIVGFYHSHDPGYKADYLRKVLRQVLRLQTQANRDPASNMPHAAGS